MLRLSESRDVLTVVDDQIGSPTYTPDLAELIVKMIHSDCYGTYNATNENFCSWAEFAAEIMKLGNKTTVIKPIPSSEYPTKATRPLNSRLSKDCIEPFGRLPSWQNALERYFVELEELFKEIKQKHIKEIRDQISYMKIRDVVNKEISNSLEELIEVDFASMLDTIDTTTSAKIKKETEIKSLNLRKAQLEQVQNEYDSFIEELGNIESLVETINKNITQIEEYAIYAMKAIESNTTYQKIYDEYSTLLTKKDVLEKDIENLEYELVSLRETRREKVLDPYARPIINELNENIAQRESKLDRSKSLLGKIEKDIEGYAKTKEDSTVVSVINEKVKCEKHLPDLYKKQRELLMIVEEKKDRLAELKKSLDEYDQLSEKLEALSNED